VAGRGTCVDGVNGFSCSCNAGYSGLQCQTGESSFACLHRLIACQKLMRVCFCRHQRMQLAALRGWSVGVLHRSRRRLQLQLLTGLQRHAMVRACLSSINLSVSVFRSMLGSFSDALVLASKQPNEHRRMRLEPMCCGPRHLCGRSERLHMQLQPGI
jgi:hypothetical protein